MSRRTGRWLVAVVLLPLVLLAAASVSADLGYTVALLDVEGQPVPGAYVAFHREAHHLSLAGAGNGAPARGFQLGLQDVAVSDERGRIGVAPSLSVHWPFPLQSPATLVIDLVYAPSLHNGLVAVSGNPADPLGPPAPSASEISVELEDLTMDPERWLRSLGNLHTVLDALDQELGKAGSAASAETRARAAEMREGAVVEYEAFQRRYRDVRRAEVLTRTIPSAPGVERAQSPQAVEPDLERAPTWGDVAERLYGPAHRAR